MTSRLEQISGTKATGGSRLVEEHRAYAWQVYSIQELGQWVHLLVKRAGLRVPKDGDKIAEDLLEAEEYVEKMREHIAHAREILSGR